MTEYLLKIMGLIIFSVVLTNALPKGKTSVLIKKVVRLCVYLSVIAPAASFFIRITNGETEAFSEIFPNYFSENVIETDEAYIKYCSENSIKNAEAELTKKILDEFGIEASVQLIFEENELEIEMKIQKICLVFTEDCEATMAEEIKNQLETEYAVPIEFLKEVKT